MLIPACPSNWPNFQRNCYKLFNTQLTWADAQTHCQQENSHLASILSEEEHQFIINKFVRDEYIWVGGHDMDVEGQWIWTDGSNWNYTRWNAGQPDNAGGKEHCLNLFKSGRDGNFNDYPCTKKIKFLCKITY